LPELETWTETWAFSETIHSRSYTHIIRNLYANPGVVFDDIVDNQHIKDRAMSVTEHYDRLIELSARRTAGLPVNQEEIEDALFLTMVSVNVLEAIRFYVSFACSFSFAERKLMVGNATIIKLIARDEALHLSATQNILQMWINGKDDPRMQEAAVRNFSKVFDIFKEAAEQEMQWAKYLFSKGSMLGLSEAILCEYVKYITDVRIKALGLSPIYDVTTNPLPWMNNYLNSSDFQPAPQENEISSYLVGAVDSSITTADLAGFTL
jgi:ribonucleoside-diphosphate reductase beta chain